MTHEKSLKERKSFSKRYIHTERDISSCSHPAHGCHLSASQQPSVMAYAGQLAHAPQPRLAYQPDQNPPMEGVSMKSLSSQPSESSPLLQNY